MLINSVFFNMKGGKLELNSFGNLPKSNSVVLREKEVPFPLLNHLTVRENASFGRSDDVTILLFRPTIAKNKPEENMALRKA